MSTSESSTPSTTYTAFWPLLIILVTFLIISGFELVNLQGQREQLRTTSVQLEKQVSQAQTLNQTLAKMSKEILLLSSTSPESQKIVHDFGIQMRQSDPAQPPPKK